MSGERFDEKAPGPPPSPPSPSPYVPHPPGWYPDPHGELEHRWWGGTQWGEDGDGTLFTESVLLPSERVRVIEGDSEYAIRDQRGRQIGAVRHLRERGLRRLVRWLTSDPAVTRRRQVTDGDGNVVMTLARPTAAWLRPRVIVRTGGQEVGRAVQQSLFRPRVTLESGGHRWGEVRRDRFVVGAYTVRDHGGTEVARYYRTWKRRSTRRHTGAKESLLHLDPSLPDPLRTLTIACALGHDLVIAQGGVQFHRHAVLPVASPPREADTG